MKHCQLPFLEAPPGRLNQQRKKHADLGYLAELKGQLLRRWRHLLFKEHENGSQKTASKIYLAVSFSLFLSATWYKLRLLFRQWQRTITVKK